MIDTYIRLLPETIAPPSTLTEVPVTELLGKAELDGDGSLTQQVYRLLRQLIVNLHLQPNQFLPEKDVAAVLDVSKTPVREAFIRLSEENLVNIVPKIGTYVAPINIKQAFKGYFIRESLESACAEALANNAPEHGLAMLQHELAAQKACIEREDNDMFYILDNQFHAAMFDAADMPTAKRLVDSAKAEVDRIKGLKSIYRFCRPEAVLYQEHLDMMEAIRNHDGRQARLEVKKHLTGMSEAIQAIVKEEKLWRLFNTINQGPHTARLSV
jgi:Transcriptional regulators